MPNANGHIYSEVVNGVKVGVNTDDVSSVTGVASHDVATLCTSDKVVKWSKHKPVRGESPADYATWNKNTGNVRATVGFPIYWGMEIPLNNAEQLQVSGGSRYLKPLAWRASHRQNANSEGNVRNYVYRKPVVGTDFCRLTDFDGYWHTATEPWSVGVVGAEDKATVTNYTGSGGTVLAVDTFDTATVGFFMGTPSLADIKFADLFPEQGYRFFIELYFSDQSASGDSTVPPAIIVTMKDLSQIDYGARFDIPVSKIADAMGFNVGSSNRKIIAVLGVNRFSTVPTLTEEKSVDNKGLGYAILTTTHTAEKNAIAVGSGSIPPWDTNHKPFICDIEFRSYSKVSLWATQYAFPATGSYANMPTSNIVYASDGIRFKMTVHNKGTSAFTFNDSARLNKFQIQARGQFDTSDPSVAAMCLTPFEGKWKEVEFGTDPSFASGFSTNPITVAAGAYKYDLYMRCFGFIPKGTVNAFTMRVSTDGGTSWVITASFSGAFMVS